MTLLIVGGSQPLVFLDPTFHSWYWSTGLYWVPPLALAGGAAVALRLSGERRRRSSDVQAVAIAARAMPLTVTVSVAIWGAELAVLHP